MNKILADNKNTYIFFLILSLLFFGNSVKNGFSLDDSYVTVTNYPEKGKEYKPNNTLVASGFKGIGKIWHSHYGHGSGTSYEYRPLVITMFAVEYGIFGQAPHVNHFINIILYATLIFCLFLLLKKCFKEYAYNEIFSLLCCVLFLAHPIHTEVVDNLKCRDELLSTLLILLATLNVLVFFEVKKVKHLLLAGALTVLSMYSKFTAATFIVLIPLILFFFSKINKKHIIFVFIGLVACFFIYRRIRRTLLTEKDIRFFYHFENPLYTEHISLYTKVLYALKTFGIYVKLFLFPYPLRFYYGTPLLPTAVNLFDIEIFIGIVFVLAAGYFCYKTKNKIAFFGLLFFLISIAPLTNFIKPVAGIIGERLCFIASIGFMIFITSVLFSLYKKVPVKLSTALWMQKPLVYLTGILVCYLFYDWNRNSAWQSEFSLYEHDWQYTEKSAGGSNLLGNKYYEMLSAGNTAYPRDVLINKSLECYTTAFQEDSSVFSALNNAGVILFSYKNQTDIALRYFKRAIINNPRSYPQAYENLGNCYKRKGDFIQSFKNYRIATLLNPQQYMSYTELIKMLFERKKLNMVLALIKEAEMNFPKNYFLTSQYANYYMMSGDTENGIRKLEEAFLISPNKKLAEYLFNKCAEFNKPEKAEYYKNQYALLQQ
jgi:tetratricopeptide (TPR) repeat protein